MNPPSGSLGIVQVRSIHLLFESLERMNRKDLNDPRTAVRGIGINLVTLVNRKDLNDPCTAVQGIDKNPGDTC